MSAVLGSKTSSLAFRVILYFARNPDEELTSEDIANKWGWNHTTCVASMLRKYRSVGILNAEKLQKRSFKGAQMLVWSAGPALLEMLN